METRTSAGCGALIIAAMAATIILAGCTRSSGGGHGPAPIIPVVIETFILPYASEGVPYSFTLTASGGTQPYTWSLTAGSLPSGVGLSPAGVISGTPTAAGHFPMTVEVTDSQAPPASNSASRVLTVLPSTAPPVVNLCAVTGTQRGLVDLCYQLTDADGNSVVILVEVSTDSGATYQVATSGPGGEGTGPVQATPTATTHLYVWDSVADIGATLAAAVRLRMTPSDSFTGTPEETADFTVDNTPGASRFIPANPMQVARMKHTATLLTDGSVLVSGGTGTGLTVLDSAEIFSPVTGEFTLLPATMTTPRSQHTASLLPDGTVLLAGGIPSTFGAEIDSAEIFDPATGTFQATGSMSDARSWHAATVGTGMAYVTGGRQSAGPTILDRTEGFDPLAGLFNIVTGTFIESRAGHTAHYLPSDRILLMGGSEMQFMLTAEEFDPATGNSPTSEASTTSLETTEHASIVLQDGTILITGGGPSWGVIGFANSFPQANLWTPGSGFTALNAMNKTRRRHTSTQVADGRVIITGGEENMTFNIMPDAEIYDPIGQTFTNTSPMTIGRYWHVAVLLQDGRVLITGGTSDGIDPVADTERFHP